MEVSSTCSDGTMVMSTDSPSTNAGSVTSILFPGSTLVFSFTSAIMIAPLYQPRFRRYRFRTRPPRRRSGIPRVALGLESPSRTAPILRAFCDSAAGIKKLQHRTFRLRFRRFDRRDHYVDHVAFVELRHV